MQDTEMIAEDIVEEHNGVYDGKWHIVSPEGFDLPEGLEYLKGGYVEQPLIKISKMSLSNALSTFCEWINRQKSEQYYRGDLEIVNCRKREMILKPGFYDVMATGISRLSVHGCNITLKDVWDVLQVSDGDIHVIDFSGNFFESNEENWSFLTKIKMSEGFWGRIYVLDLSNSNLDNYEKEAIKEAFKDKIQLFL